MRRLKERAPDGLMRSVSEIGTTPGDAQTEASTPQEKCPKREAWSPSAAPKTTNILEGRGSTSWRRFLSAGHLPEEVMPRSIEISHLVSEPWPPPQSPGTRASLSGRRPVPTMAALGNALDFWSRDTPAGRTLLRRGQMAVCSSDKGQSRRVHDGDLIRDTPLRVCLGLFD